MSTSTHRPNKDCPLLNMPVETLQRITDLLDKREDLSAVRLACKTLDYVSLKRFTRAFFTTVTCCIFYESRWLRLMNIVGGPSRITRRIKLIDLTTCFFEDGGYSNLQLAPVQADANNPLSISQSAAFLAHSKAEGAAVQHLPKLALMSRVLRNIEKLLPRTVVRLHLVDNHCEANGHINAHRDALFTLAAAHSLRLRGLHLNPDSIWGLDASFAHLHQDLLRCTSKLESFQLYSARRDFRRVGGPFETNDSTLFNNAYEILRSAKKLRVLYLNLALVHHLDALAVTTARGFLEAAVSSYIRSLKLNRVRVDEEVLLKALPRWAASLRFVTLEIVGIKSVHKGWPAVLHTLSTMPNLNFLEIRSLIEAGEAGWPHTGVVSLEPPHITLKTRGWDFSLEPSGGKKKYDGRVQVSSGLEELLAKPLMYEDHKGQYTGQRSNVDG
jgi:hypothetical protein